MIGSLFHFDDCDKKLVAFESFDCINEDKCLVLLGGMGDGLASLPFTKVLSEFLEKRKISLVSPILSSSYSQFGISSLKKDVTEIKSLIDYLLEKRGKNDIILFGHSSGCQQILQLYETFPDLQKNIRLTVLQGGISDRDVFIKQNGLEELQRIMKWMTTDVQKKDLLYPEFVFDAPIKASRLHSLLVPNTVDDFFSENQSFSKRSERIKGLSREHTMILFSEDDEYLNVYSSSVRKLITFYEIEGFENLHIIEGATHAINDNGNGQQNFLSLLNSFLTKNKL